MKLLVLTHILTANVAFDKLQIGHDNTSSQSTRCRILLDVVC